MKRILHPVMVLALVGLCSCATQGPTSHMAPARVYNVVPKDMVELAKQAIAAEPLKLGVANDEGSVITTTWREGYQGNYHITRYWQERTQFRINIIPDWQNPQSQCRVEVSEKTEERSNRRGEWRPNIDTYRPERCEEVVAQIEKQLPAGTKVSVAAGQPAGATPVATAAPATPVIPAAQATPATPGAAASPATPATPAIPVVAPVPAGWRNGSGSFTTTLSVADAGQRIETTIKAMQLEVKQSKLTAIDGNMVVQGATGPEIGIIVQAETSGATRVTVSQLGNQAARSANPQLVFTKLQQELTK